VAGPGDDFIQKHAKTTDIHGFPSWSTMIYLFYFPGGFSISFCQFTGG
jgi:hypothetical protein